MRDEREAIRSYDAWLRSASFSSPEGLTAILERGLLLPGPNHLQNAGLFRLPSILPIAADERVAGVGAGTAVLLRSIDAQVHLRRPPILLEGAGVALKTLRRVLGHSRVQPMRSAGTRLPLPAGSLDLVLCGHYAHLLAHGTLFALYLEVQRVLRPGGRFLLWDYAPVGGLPGRVNQKLLALGTGRALLRSYADYVELASQARFGWIERLDIRPFLFPPIPRVCVLIRSRL